MIFCEKTFNTLFDGDLVFIICEIFAKPSFLSDIGIVT